VTKGLKRFLEESECHLAVSLHSPYPMERLSLMPVEKAFPAREVIDLIKQYDFSHQRRVSFEYIVFKNLNVETVIRFGLHAYPYGAVSISKTLKSSSTLSSGSPIPMKTIFVNESFSGKDWIWFNIWFAVRFAVKPCFFASTTCLF